MPPKEIVVFHHHRSAKRQRTCKRNGGGGGGNVDADAPDEGDEDEDDNEDVWVDMCDDDDNVVSMNQFMLKLLGSQRKRGRRGKHRSEEEEEEEEEEEDSESGSGSGSESNSSCPSSSSGSGSDTDADADADADGRHPDWELEEGESEEEQQARLQRMRCAMEELTALSQKHPADRSIHACARIYKQDYRAALRRIEQRVARQKRRNARLFMKSINYKAADETSFYQKMDVAAQQSVLTQLSAIQDLIRVKKPYKIVLLERDIPLEIKAVALKKIHVLQAMDPSNSEFYKMHAWVDAFMKLPFGIYRALPLSRPSSRPSSPSSAFISAADHAVKLSACHEFMARAQQTLEDAVFGLNDAKMQIMQMLGQFLTNPGSVGTSIAIHGPPGTGKTSLVKEGISKILDRPFAFVALGGASDSSFLEGHGYTYEGSTWGKIAQILMESQCMNPVIYFDELDKISDTPRGEEIAGILTHLTDSSQNAQFHDKYFSEIPFDLSKCLFIFSYNDERRVNSVLKDRMYRIKTDGYAVKEKMTIASKYLLPAIRKQLRFGADDVRISDEVVAYIHESRCGGEAGVRNLKRCLEIIHSKLNLYRLMKPGTNLFQTEMALTDVQFPFTVTRDVVDKLVKQDAGEHGAWRSMYT